MTNPLATPAAQAILAEKSFDDFIASTIFANDMTPHLSGEQRALYSIKGTIYWLQARGAQLPEAVVAELAEWEA